MLAMSHIPSGLTSRFHLIEVEGFFVVDDSNVSKPSTARISRRKGRTVIPTGIAMRLVATGPTPRRALAVIVYDASQPPTRGWKVRRRRLMSCNGAHAAGIEFGARRPDRSCKRRRVDVAHHGGHMRPAYLTLLVGVICLGNRHLHRPSVPNRHRILQELT